MRFAKHPATVIATVALFIALGGGAAAYASGLINGSQIKNHSIAAKKLTAAAIKSLRGKRGPAGPRGTQGTQGIQGIQGVQGNQGQIGPSSATSAYNTNQVAYGSGTSTIGSLALSAGSYVVMASTTINDNIEDQDTRCTLDDSIAGTIDERYTSTATVYPAQTSLSLVAPLETTGSTVSVNCYGGTNASATETHITAIKVGSVTGDLRHFSKKALSPMAGK